MYDGEANLGLPRKSYGLTEFWERVLEVEAFDWIGCFSFSNR